MVEMVNFMLAYAEYPLNSHPLNEKMPNSCVLNMYCMLFIHVTCPGAAVALLSQLLIC